MKETTYPLDEYTATIFYVILECAKGILVKLTEMRKMKYEEICG
jgi:hypothetical protein